MDSHVAHLTIQRRKKAMKSLTIIVLASAAVWFSTAWAGDDAPNPVTAAFVDGCHLVARSTGEIKAASEFRQQNALLCAMTVKSAFEIASSAKRFSYKGINVCIPPSASALEVSNTIVRRTGQAPHLMNMADPAELTAAVMATRYKCDG